MKATRPFLGGRCLLCTFAVVWDGDESGPGEHGWVHLSFDSEQSDHDPVVFASGLEGVAA